MNRDTLISNANKPCNKVVIQGVTEENLYEHPVTISKAWLPIKSLIEEAKFNNRYVENVKILMKKMIAWKKCRGDGNCYYRAVISHFVITLFSLKTDLTHFYNFLMKLNQLQSANYSLFANELSNCYQTLLMEYQKILNNSNYRPQALLKIHDLLQDTAFDDCLIKVARLLAYHALLTKKDNENISPFVIEEEVSEILNGILKFGQEAEGLELFLLPLELDIEVNQINLFESIVYNHYPFQDTGNTKLKVFIICKSRGHYDTLYSKQQLEDDQYIWKEFAFYY